MRIAIHGKSTGPEAQKCISDLLEIVKPLTSHLSISESYQADLSEKDFNSGIETTFSIKDDLSEYDFLLSLGGDGTILDSITYTRDSELPIIGINLGRLGFLSTTPRTEIQSVMDRLIKQEYTIESRSLVHVDSNIDLFLPAQFRLE